MSKINVLGASCMDILVSDVVPSSFFSGFYKTKNISSSFGGDALNEAVVLSSLGGDVCLNTIVGDDVAGRMLIDHLQNNGG